MRSGIKCLCDSQGNCQCCMVPKFMLDDVDSNFPPRTKENMQKALMDALFKGIYPGWQNDLLQGSRKSFSQHEATLQPRPLINAAGKIVSRASKASSRLGRHLLSVFFDQLKEVDLHQLVIFQRFEDVYIIIVVHKLKNYCLCTVNTQIDTVHDVLFLFLDALQAGNDIMHTVDLGIWVHLLTCIAVQINDTCLEGNILLQAQVLPIWRELNNRAQSLNPDDCMFKMNDFKANYLHHLWKVKTHPDKSLKTMEAWEHHIMMLVCISLIFLHCCTCQHD